MAGLFDINIEILKYARGHSVAFTQEPQQNVLGAHVGVLQLLGFLGGKVQNLLYARGIGNVADLFLVRARTDLFFHLKPHGLQIEPHLLEHVNRHALPKLDEPKQQMLRAHKVVVKSVRLLARQRQHLLRSRRKIAHALITHRSNV